MRGLALVHVHMHPDGRRVYVHPSNCAFSLIFPLYSDQITNSNVLPLAIIAHFSADPTRWGGGGGSECATVCLCTHQNGEGKLSKCAKK